MRAPFIATGVAVLSLAAWLLSPHGERSRGAPAATPIAAHQDEADAKLAALSARLSSLERGALGRAVSEATPAPVASTPGAPSVNREARDEPRHTRDEVFEGLERRLKTEAKDPAWSAKAEANIATALRTEALAGSTLVRADCGTTFCRVEVSHDSGPDQQRFLKDVRHTPPFDVGGVARQVVDPGSGATRTLVYMARDENGLPRLDDG